MSFAARLTRSPRPFDPDRATDVLRHFPDATGPMADLIAGTAGCSPFLAGLMSREAAWLTEAFDDPETAIAALFRLIDATPPDTLSRVLRQAKSRLAALVALADLGGVWSLGTVTGHLTDFADHATHVGLTRLTAAEISRGTIPGLAAQDAATAGGMVVIGMGKMGAHELNYSSDIDLIVLFDETRFDRKDETQARAAFIKITRRLTAMLSDATGDGYVFRTDLRLRPDASVTPVCLSMAAAESYYESVGRTWERAAYIKARPAAGDLAAGQRFLDTLRPFVWRKHLDFAAIQDAHDMRLRIRDHKGLRGALNLEGHNMKLWRGGIREIEFFTQTRQLIAGGRDPSLRVRGTLEGLERLAKAGWIPADVATGLSGHYAAHREVEHRVQMIGDAQTHDLPTSEEGFARLAAFMDKDVPDLRRELIARLEAVHDLTEGFFAPGHAAAPPDDFGAEVTARWRTYPALRSERAVVIFKRLLPDILRSLKEAAKPDEALAAFDGFLAGLPSGVQLFSLFEANPQLTRLMVDIAATAPALARYLSRNAGVLDAVIGGRFFAEWPGREGLIADLSAQLAERDSYEQRLDQMRRFRKEWQFRTGVHHLRGLIPATEAARQYTDLADALLVTLWIEVVAQFITRHGKPPGQGAVVIGMGSLGAGRLTAASDLDLIVIYDPDGVDASDGPRPLATRAYYAKLTQALVTAITAPTAEGRLYEVDMRLRPSGRQGPVATAISAFEDYQRTEAWTWEHLALTRARPVAGNPALGDRVETFRAALLAEKSKGPQIRADVSEMRSRLAAAKPPESDWDAKIGPGRLQDIELIAQTACLLTGSDARQTSTQIAAGVAGGIFSVAEGEVLVRALGLYWQAQAASRLLTGGTLDPETLGEGGTRVLLRETGFGSMDDLLAAMRAAATATEQVIDRVLTGQEMGSL
jgi:[glutamine synthetase] adenylyltransferase / [glutamine synthetase]-adenylyl-L-tyrosine phosphorylase